MHLIWRMREIFDNEIPRIFGQNDGWAFLAKCGGWGQPFLAPVLASLWKDILCCFSLAHRMWKKEKKAAYHIYSLFLILYLSAIPEPTRRRWQELGHGGDKKWRRARQEIRGHGVTSQDVRLEINRNPKCALHSCIENPGNFHAFNKTYQSDRGFACVNGNRVSHQHECDKFRHDFCWFS
jgi:hypothetical protein